MKYEIEKQLRTYFKAESDLDTVKAIFIGEPPFILTNHYPAIIIFAEQRMTSIEESGMWIYFYTGYVAVEHAVLDHYEVVDRESDIESLLTVRDVLDNCTRAIEKNVSMGNLTHDTETVRAIQLGQKNYGLRKRDNNYFNRGEVNFEVETARIRENA